MPQIEEFKVGSAEHDELLAMFEREYNVREQRATKETRSLWAMGRVYCHGETNEQFIAYRKGYVLARSMWIQRLA